MKFMQWLACVTLTACGFANSVQAKVFDFGYVAPAGPSGFETGAGTFTTSNTEIGGRFKVTGVSGVADGPTGKGGLTSSKITGLSLYAYADDFLSPAAPYFSLGGLAFATASGGAFNLYSDLGENFIMSSNLFPVGYYADGSPATVTISEVSSGAPEPSTWALMLLGFGGLGSAMRASRRSRATAPA